MAYSTRFHILLFTMLFSAAALLAALPSYGDDYPPPGTYNQKKSYTFPQPESTGMPARVVAEPGKRLPGTGLQSTQNGPSTLPGSSRLKSRSSYSFPQPGGTVQQSSQEASTPQASTQVRTMAPYSFPRASFPSNMNNNSAQSDPYNNGIQFNMPRAYAVPYNSNSATYPGQQNSYYNPYASQNRGTYMNQNSTAPYTNYNNNQLYQDMMNLYNTFYNNGGRAIQLNPNSSGNGLLYQFFRYANSSGSPTQNIQIPYNRFFPSQGTTYPYSIYPYRNNTNNNGTYYWRGQ
jgi:hypothetical protein